MTNDLKLIVHKFDENITIYPISDVHLGSLEHNANEWQKFVDTVREEPNSYIILAGDLMNNATRSSVSNIFEDVLRPKDQKERLIKHLTPLKNKILCAVSGNHERRSSKDADNDPMYDIMCKLDLEDLYRENIAFMKIQIGDKGRKQAYTFAVTHGAGGGINTGGSVNKNERFATIIDNLDCFVVGHTHKGAVTKPSKIVIDPRTNTVSIKEFVVITSQSWLKYGGYAMQKMLFPASNASAANGQKLVLNKNQKVINVVW